MCRLSAVASPSRGELLTPVRALLMHLLLTHSVADDDQSYGAGITDGSRVVKSGGSYQDSTLSGKLMDFRVDVPLVGHARKPSPGTDRSSTLAAHPFGMRPDGITPFVAAHNGYADVSYEWRDVSTPVSSKEKAFPSSDTYRSLMLLCHMMGQYGRSITPELLAEWMGCHTDLSSSSWMFIQNKELYVLRGERTIYVMPVSVSVGGGTGWDAVLLNTSQDVLRAVSSSLELFGHLMYGVGVCADTREITEIPEKTLLRLRQLEDQVDFSTQTVDYSYTTTRGAVDFGVEFFSKARKPRKRGRK